MKINGLPVKDGRSVITLTINANDVKRGTIKDPTECAAALACKRLLGSSEARVHVGRTYLRFNNHWERYMTSKSLRTEIVAFDRGGKFHPGEYTLLKMTPTKRTGKRQSKSNIKWLKTKRRRYHTLSGVRPMGLSA